MQHNKFKLSKSRLTVVLAAAFAMPVAAYAAAPAAGQLPGVGVVQSLTGSGTVKTSTSTSTSTMTLTVTGANVINWGKANGSSIINSGGTPGFNIGSNATVDVVSTSTKASSVLNVDISGNPSQIFGKLVSSNTNSTHPAATVFISNANGIVVGSGATIVAPSGLGLINADLSSTAAQQMFVNGNVPLSFTGASGGVTINAGADLSQVGGTTPGTGFLLVAGAGNVNVTGQFLNTPTNKYVYSINPNASLVVDAGVGGYASASNGKLTVGIVGTGSQQHGTDQGPATALNKLATAAADVAKNSYATVAGNATLDLGNGSSAFNLSTNSAFVANGNITTSGNIANIGGASATAPFAWTGTFTNNGTLSWGKQSGATYFPSTYTGISTLVSTGSPIYANTTKQVKTGSLVNASGATINGGSSVSLTGASVDNEGAINLNGATANDITLTALSGNITLGGTVNLTSTATTKYLGSVTLGAGSKPGQTVNINTPLTLGNTSTAGTATVSATNLNINKPVVVGGPTVGTGAGSFNFYPFASSARPIGNVNIASGAGVTAGNVYFGANNSSGTGIGSVSLTNYTINAPVVATNSGGQVAFGGNFAHYQTTKTANGLVSTTLTSSATVSTGNVTGSGSIGGDYITFNNLQGSVNNITTNQILANGFALNAGPSGNANISVTANGSAAQGFNVMVNGNAVVNSGGTLAVQIQTPAGNPSAMQYLYPANANSKMVVQATGTLTANAGYVGSNYGGVPGPLFQFPGLIYLQGNNGITVNAAIANAYTTNAPTGNGVWVVGKTISDAYPVYASGGRGVNFVAPFANGSYGYATINGQPMGTGEPTVYFASAGNASAVSGANPLFSLQPTSTFTNEKGYQQQNQVFLTVTPQ